MGFVLVDDHWGGHPKVLATGLDGMGLHIWGLTYCNAHLTDGFVPHVALPGLRGVRTAATALERAGLWEPVEGGWRVHDYADYQWTREQIAARHARKAAAGRMGADSRWHSNGMADG
jgi:hypothetical protein